MIQKIINRYKRARTNAYLSQNYDSQFAFIGMGQHSLNNLYPVLDYLHIPLKYICVTSEDKAKLIGRKFQHIKGTTSVDDILNDDSVKGVFVSVSPFSHFEVAKKVLKSGKSLFIEKPPCSSLDELLELIDLQHKHGFPTVVAGLQKRYSPVIGILCKRLKKEKIISYNLRYLTGAYPEGNALIDLYIHPLDIVTYLFGGAELIACERISSDSLMMILKHGNITGTLELSTEYSWINAQETLSVCTHAGVYTLDCMEELTFMPRQGKICGIPLEKIFNRAETVEYLYSRNNFSPILANNQVYTQGFYNEIKAFADSVESFEFKNNSGPDSLIKTYELIEMIKNTIKLT